jgi:hypothetical protein
MNFNEVVATLIAGACAIGFVWCLSEIALASRSTHWPRTVGRIEQSNVKVEEDEGRAYIAAVTYSYLVDGQSYTGDRVSFGPVWKHAVEWWARKTVGVYEPGSAVTVTYDPANPRRAVLRPGVLRSAVGGAIFCVIVAGGAFAVLYVA